MKQPTAAQKRWMSDIADWAEQELGRLYNGYQGESFQLHHVTGRAAKHNKVEIGHWFILPVPIQLHDVMSNHPLNVTHHKKNFTDEFGMQRHLFADLVCEMNTLGFDIPPDDVLDAIQDTNA